MGISYLIFLTLPFLVLVGGFHDLLTYRIPNILSGLLILGFVLFAFSSGMGWEQIIIHCAWGLGALVLTFLMFNLRLMGGGDAKLISVIALWIGHSMDMLLYLVAMSLWGAVLCIGLLYFRKIPVLPEPLLNWNWLTSLHGIGQKHSRNVPYAVAIAGGLVMVLPDLTVFRAII